MNCEDIDCEKMDFKPSDRTCLKLQYSDIVKALDKTLSHLGETQRDELKMLSFEYKHLFPNIPTRTCKIYYDVNVEGSKPVKQHPYRVNPIKLRYLREEIKYLLDNDFMKPSQSHFTSPCILVPKFDETF